MSVPKYMGDITQHAYDGFEKYYDYDEMLDFLRDPTNFMSVRKGILRELRECLDFDVRDDEVFGVLKRVVEEYGFDPDDIKDLDKNIIAWFDGSKLPDRAWATKLCFAFGLNNEEAGHFLWKVCKLNGFSVRSAEQVIYCYCLANGKFYEYAKGIIAEFATEIANNPQIQEYKKTVQKRIKDKDSNFTVRTDELLHKFANLKGLDEQAFKKRMFDHAKYFIDYSISAYHEMVAIYNEAKEQIKKDRPIIEWLSDTVELKNKDAEDGKRYATRNFSSPCEYSVVHNKEGEIVKKQFDGKYDFDSALIWQHLVKVNVLIGKKQSDGTRPIKAISHVCNHVQILLESLPSASRLQELTKPSRPENATKNGTARMVFVFLYFAQFVIRWERYLFDIEEKGDAPNKFFSVFYNRLGNLLDSCGYGNLYYANPFDWHILSCVRLLDEGSKSDDELGALEWFNKAMARLAGDYDE
ncbi:MAG: hypothetical protein FWB92_06415 [Oscillospiraceae bacterium]|nr:hypothetical protein [Oscillospiraceae bacterium]